MLRRLFPVLEWLPRYKYQYLSSDIFAGITVGVMLIPQGMAYAMIAGLPPVYGLYAALLPQIIYAITGTSRQLAVGPVAMDSLLVAAGLGALQISGLENYIAAAIFLALFMGALQLLFGLLKMGFLVNFLSKPVISGFTSAAAIIIGLSQLKHLLGFSVEGSNKVHVLLVQTFSNISQTHLLTLTIGLIAILILKVLKRISKKIPGALLVVIFGILSIYIFGWHEDGVAIVREIPKGLPSFQIPRVPQEQLLSLFPIAITLALIAFMEAFSVGKAVEEKHDDYQIDPNQELRALGLSNIVGAFFQSYPTTGGFSRTAVNEEAGAKTGIASLTSALLIGLTLLFFTDLFYYLPNAILGAIIMVAVFGLINIKYPKQLFRQQRDEFWLLIITFIITLTIGIVEGILLGVLFSLLLLVYRVSKPHMAILGRIQDTDYFKNVNRFSEDIQERKDLLILRFDAQLFFGNQAYFKRELLKHMDAKGTDLKAVILNAEAINYIDSSAIEMLKKFITDLHDKEIQFLLAGAIGPLRDRFSKSGLTALMGEENLFVRTYEAVNYYDGLLSSSEERRKITRQSTK